MNIQSKSSQIFDFMKPLPQHKEQLFEILRFVIVGALATAIQFVVYYLLVQIIHHNIALLISYLISLLFNFILTTYFTFHVKPTAKKGIGFLTSHMVNLSLQFILLNFFLWLGFDKQWALIPVFLICIPVNFILVRLSVKKL